MALNPTYICRKKKQGHGSQEKTFAKRLENDKKKAETSLRKLEAREFACELDARIADEKWLQEHPQFRFTVMNIRTITQKKEKKRGKPKVDEPMETVYAVSAEFEDNPGVVAESQQKLGRFVLATNDLDLSPDELLVNYKEQGAVERGFRFLKDPSFRVAEIFLKKPSRTQALAMIMVLCLFVYAMTEFRLRRNLQETGEAVNRPDEEADPKTYPEVDVLPLPRSPGTPVLDRGGGDGAGHKHGPGTLDAPSVAREGV